MYGLGSSSPGSFLTYNINDGYLEGIVRGFRSGLLATADYNNLSQCDSLEDMKLHLQSTDYGDFLAAEPSPLQTTTINDKCTVKMVKEFNHLRVQANQPLAQFLDFITYQYMIDNVVLLITGTLHERDSKELVEKCHPLGMFESIESLTVANNVSELYHTVLVETPLGPYLKDHLSETDFDEMNIEIIRNTLYKSYLENFHAFCMNLGGETATIMNEILKFEADRRCINITLNSFGTELSKEDRPALYPNIGYLVPEGVARLAKAEDFDQVRAAMEAYQDYRAIFLEAGGNNQEKSLEDAFYEREVFLCEMAFETQFGYGCFYAFFKLREQEIRNIVWIAECIQQDVKGKIGQYVPIFKERKKS